MTKVNQSAVIEGWIHRLKDGDDQARKELINCACERLTSLTRKMLKGYAKVKRWEQTDDVMQNALLRLYRTLEAVQPANSVEFYRLAAVNIRRELIDLARHYYGPQGLGANYLSVDLSAEQALAEQGAHVATASVENPGQLEAWTAFHDAVGRLPVDERDVFDLLWYQELSQAETAELLNISIRTVKRRWAAARLQLHEVLDGKLPEI
jgi:RNA polymerase sigma-70 factor (ECF subfamily)